MVKVVRIILLLFYLHVGKLTHKISAGFPSPSSAYIKDGLDLTAYLIYNKTAGFLFTVTSNSMSAAAVRPPRALRRGDESHL